LNEIELKKKKQKQLMDEQTKSKHLGLGGYT
jgi:hypothetical protein